MVIKVDSVSFSYAAQEPQVLKDISFQIESGTFCVVLGGNGSGKTTLLHLLNKVLTPDLGQISINNNQVGGLTYGEIAKLVSYVPQEHSNIAPYSVKDVVVMGRTPFLKIGEVPAECDYLLVESILDSLNGKHLLNKYFNEISGGERQIVLIARALMQNTPIIILDEPSNHLDFSRQASMFKLLKQISSEEGKTIITTTHDPNLIYSIADQVIMLADGEIFENGAASEVITAQNISSVYQVDAKLYALPDKKTFIYAD